MIKYFLLLWVVMGTLDAKTVCLNMIVKNESDVIERCLNSCKNLVDYWVIVDTGSDDNTKELIKKIMQGKPGELHERPWVNFAHNRNEAFALARSKADYLLFIDADEELVFSKKFNKKHLSKPYYHTVTTESGFSSVQPLLVETSHPWKWIGVVHESIYCEGIPQDTSPFLEGIFKLSHSKEGYRSKDPEKYLKDAQVLEKALRQDPDNPRDTFYLAQCYNMAQEPLLALKAYERRVKMGGSEEERWYSLYMIARFHDGLGFPSDQLTKEYCQAFQERNFRAEPLGHLAQHHLVKGNFAIAYTLAKQALSMQKPQDVAFVENWLYDYGFLAIYADSSWALGQESEALAAYQKIINSGMAPSEVSEKVLASIQRLKMVAKKEGKEGQLRP